MALRRSACRAPAQGFRGSKGVPAPGDERGTKKWTVPQPRGLREDLPQSRSEVSVCTAPHLLAPSL